MTQKYKKMTENNRSWKIVKNSTEKLVFNFRHFWGELMREIIGGMTGDNWILNF